MNKLENLIKNNKGSTSIEYGLIAALVFLTIVAGVSSFSNSTTNIYNKITNSVASASK